VGGSTMGTLLANAIAPGLLDRYLAKTGFSSQQTPERHDPDQPVNLWEPADRDTDFGTHGTFDGKAVSSSYQLWASQHHGVVLAAAGAGAVGVLAGATALLRGALGR
ncbi:MAG TPA: short-chain dehydrogenase, partial [Micrococcaceae bacterium]